MLVSLMLLLVQELRGEPSVAIHDKCDASRDSARSYHSDHEATEPGKLCLLLFWFLQFVLR